MKSVAVIVFAGLVVAGCAEPAAQDPVEVLDLSSDGEEGAGYVGIDQAGKGDLPEGFGGAIEFEAACEPGDDLTIAAVGDVLLHGRLQRQAYSEANGAVSLWEGIADLLERADVTYANLEGPTARGTNVFGREVADPGKVFDGSACSNGECPSTVVYTSYPMFNYHPSLLDGLIESGVDVVSTSNNHSLDRRSRGADLTIEELESRGLAFTGTRRSDSASEEWWTIVERGGFRLAFLGCTYGTNGIPDTADQVLFCFRDASRIESIVRELSRRADVDAVIVTPHWGVEYTAIPNAEQFGLSHRLLDAGALAVIGNHPHVIQPWERYVTADGRETFAIYSLGNFVSGQSHLPRRTTVLLYLGLFRAADGQVKVRGARYVPLHMTRRDDGLISLEAVDRAGNFGDSREHVIELMGATNLIMPHEPIVTNPQCDPDWLPHHPHDGWVGGSCSDDEACGGDTVCKGDAPGGLCTSSCSGGCPDVVGRPTTFCVELNSGAGSCVASCESSTECRVGYECREEARFGGATATRKVCVPT